MAALLVQIDGIGEAWPATGGLEYDKEADEKYWSVALPWPLRIGVQQRFGLTIQHERTQWIGEGLVVAVRGLPGGAWQHTIVSNGDMVELDLTRGDRGMALVDGRR